jgi:hypothetical protein
MATLGEIGFIRSKNAGPFVLVFDIIFRDARTFAAVKSTGILTEEVVAVLYSLGVEQVGLIYYYPALAIKVYIQRPVSCGDPLDGDVYGGQQYVPLMQLLIPDDLLRCSCSTPG